MQLAKIAFSFHQASYFFLIPAAVRISPVVSTSLPDGRRSLGIRLTIDLYCQMQLAKFQEIFFSGCQCVYTVPSHCMRIRCRRSSRYMDVARNPHTRLTRRGNRCTKNPQNAPAAVNPSLPHRRTGFEWLEYTQ